MMRAIKGMQSAWLKSAVARVADTRTCGPERACRAVLLLLLLLLLPPAAIATLPLPARAVVPAAPAAAVPGHRSAAVLLPSKVLMEALLTVMRAPQRPVMPSAEARLSRPCFSLLATAAASPWEAIWKVTARLAPSARQLGGLRNRLPFAVVARSSVRKSQLLREKMGAPPEYSSRVTGACL
jgi:hypothetical protein